MAHFHFNISSIQRSKGKNAVARAAYISASKLVYKTTCQDTGEEISITYNFTKEKGIVHSKIFVPEGFEDAAWLQDRQQLWNAAEAREKRADSITGTLIEFALPQEVSQEANVNLAEEFVQKNIVARGLVCDVNINYKNIENPHVNILCLTRKLTRLDNDTVFFARSKDREFSSIAFLYILREQCEIEINKVYEEAGLSFKVSAKSYKALGIDKIPTRHVGPRYNKRSLEITQQNEEIRRHNNLKNS